MLIGIFREKITQTAQNQPWKTCTKEPTPSLTKENYVVNEKPFTTKIDIIEKWCVQWSTLYLLTRTVRFFFLFTRGLSSSSSDSPESSSSSDDEFEPGSLVSTSDSAFFSSASSSIRPPPSSLSSSPDSSLQRSARYGQILISLFKTWLHFHDC